MELEGLRNSRIARYRYKKYLEKKREQRKKRIIAAVGVGTLALVLLKLKKHV